MKTKMYNDMTNHTSAIYTENDNELSQLIVLGAICDENQTEQWHDQSIGPVYGKIKTELLRSIWSGAVWDENYIGQRRDQSYKCDLRKKWKSAVLTDQITHYLWRKPNRIMTWLIVQV